MMVSYMNYFYTTKVANYISQNNLSGIENDFKKLVFVDKIYNINNLIALPRPLNVLTGVGIYYSSLLESINLNYTVLDDTSYHFYTTTFTITPHQNALIVDANNQITAVIHQSEDRPEDYSLRIAFLVVMIKEGEFYTTLSTLKSNENFELDVFCLELESVINNNADGESYLFIKSAKFEDGKRGNFIKSIVSEPNWHLNYLVISDNDYLSCNFNVEQKYHRIVNVLRSSMCS